MVSKFGKTSGHVGTKGLKSWRNKPATSYLQLLYQVMAPSSHLHWQTNTNSSRWCLQIVHLPMISCFNNKFGSCLKAHFDEKGCWVCYAPRSVHQAVATRVCHKVSIELQVPDIYWYMKTFCTSLMMVSLAASTP